MKLPDFNNHPAIKNLHQKMGITPQESEPMKNETLTINLSHHEADSMNAQRVTKKEVKNSWYGGYKPRHDFYLERDGDAQVLFVTCKDNESVLRLCQWYNVTPVAPKFGYWEAYRLTRKG
jgi:hypothetical protein